MSDEVYHSDGLYFIIDTSIQENPYLPGLSFYGGVDDLTPPPPQSKIRYFLGNFDNFDNQTNESAQYENEEQESVKGVEYSSAPPLPETPYGT